MFFFGSRKRTASLVLLSLSLALFLPLLVATQLAFAAAGSNPLTVAENSVSLTLSRTDVVAGDSVAVSGTADPDTFVSIKLLDSKGGIVYYNAVKSDGSGNYSDTFGVPSVAPGTLTCVAGYGNNVATAYLKVAQTTGGGGNDGDGTGGGGGSGGGKNEAFALVGAYLATINGDTFTDSQALTGGAIQASRPTIRIVFNKNVTSETEWSNNRTCFTLRESSGKQVSITVSRIGSGGQGSPEEQKRSIFITPQTELVRGKTYEIVISARLKAHNGSLLEADQTISFSVSEATTSPTSPGGGAAGQAEPGVAAPLSDQLITDAIRAAGRTGKVVINAGSGQDTMALTGSQLALLDSHGTGATLAVGAVTFTLPAANVEQLATTAGAQVQFSARQLSSSEAADLTSRAGNGSMFRVGTAVFDLTAVTVASDGSQTPLSSLTAAIEVGLPVPEDLWDEAAQGLLTVGYYNPSTNSWEEIAGAYNASTHVMTFSTSHLSMYALLEKQAGAPALPAAPVTFTDIAGHWAQRDIELMAEKGIAGGVAPGKFDPSGRVTRAQFAAFLNRSLGVQENRPEQGHFGDVPASSWYYGAVETALANKLMGGYGDGAFKPEGSITRQEVACTIARALANGGKPAAGTAPDVILARFSDATQVGPWAKEAVAAVVNQGIMAGREGGRFAPEGITTRAEAMVILKRVLEALGKI